MILLPVDFCYGGLWVAVDSALGATCFCGWFARPRFGVANLSVFGRY